MAEKDKDGIIGPFLMRIVIYLLMAAGAGLFLGTVSDDICRAQVLQQDLNPEGEKKLADNKNAELERTDFYTEENFDNVVNYETIGLYGYAKNALEDAIDIELPDMPYVRLLTTDLWDFIRDFSRRGVKEENQTGPTETVELDFMSIIGGAIREETVNISWYQEVTAIYDLMKVIVRNSDLYWVKAVQGRDYIRVLKEWKYLLHYGTTDKINIAASINPTFKENGDVDVEITNIYFMGENGSFKSIAENEDLTNEEHGMTFKGDPVVPSDNGKKSVTYGTIGSTSVNQDSTDKSIEFDEKNSKLFDQALKKIQEKYKPRARQNICALELLRLKERSEKKINGDLEEKIRASLINQYGTENIGDITFHYIAEIYLSNYTANPIGKPAAVINIDEFDFPTDFENDEERGKCVEKIVASGIIPKPYGLSGTVVTGDMFEKLANRTFDSEVLQLGYENDTDYLSFSEEILQLNTPLSEQENTVNQTPDEEIKTEDTTTQEGDEIVQ